MPLILGQIETAILNSGEDAIEGERVGLQDVSPGLGVAAMHLDQLFRRFTDSQRTPREVLRALGRVLRVADDLQLGANAPIEGHDPTCPQSLVNLTISRRHGAGGRLHVTSFHNSDSLFGQRLSSLVCAYYQSRHPTLRAPDKTPSP